LHTAQTRITAKNDITPHFDLFCDFDVKLTLQELKENCLKIVLMEQNSKGAGEPVSFISIDFMALAFGPVHHTIRFRKNGGKEFIGMIQYNIHFQLLSNTEISIRYLEAVFHNLEDRALCTSFRLITPEIKEESTTSYSKVGEYNTKENKTILKMDFSKDKRKRPALKVGVSLQTLLDSSLQV
jgi:hypothetical protein